MLWGKNYVIALVMFFENIRNSAKKMYRVLSCVLYSIIEKHICIEYLCCESRIISDISSVKCR